MVPCLFSSPLLSHRLVRRARLLIPLLTVAFGLALQNAPARADEWSVVPAGDPIYRQLGVIDQFGDGKTTKAFKGLTRYEAALQVARAITFSGTESAALPRTGWRALSDLAQSLRPELTQLGIDVNATLAMCAKNLAVPGPKSGIDTSVSGSSGVTARGSQRGGLRSPGNPFLGATGMRSPLLSSAGTAQQDAALGLTSSAFQLPLSQRLRLNASALTLGSTKQRPYAGFTPRNLGSSTDIAYDLNSWLTVRAGTTQRDLLGDPSQAPLFSSSFFNGASQARSTGGGLNVNLGRLSLSGDVESLGTDTGERGTLVGGGVGLSPWDRLSLSARLSILRSAEKSDPISTGTELGIGLDVTRRLRLNVLYQSLFTQQSVNNASRVSGGLSLSF